MRTTTFNLTCFLTILVAALSASGHAFAQRLIVSDLDRVRSYDPATGAVIDAEFISTLSDIGGINNPQQLAQVGNRLFVANLLGNDVSEHNATTGEPISQFVTTLGNIPNQPARPVGLAVSGNTLFVSDFHYSRVSTADLGSGAVIDHDFINFPTIPSGNIPSGAGLAIHGNRLYAAQFAGNANPSPVGVYDATTGATINNSFIPNLIRPFALAISGDDLYVAIAESGVPGSGRVGKFNALTGDVINANLVTGLTNPYGLAVLGNDLFVSNFTGLNIGKYDATTGAAIDANFITGLSGPSGLLIAVPVPEPSISLLALFGIAAPWLIRRKRTMMSRC